MIRFSEPRLRLDRRADRALRLPGVADAVEDLARDIAAEARTIANAEAYDTGTYAKNFKVVTGRDGDRAVAAVMNDDHKALWIEFGTRSTPGGAVLRRAGERIARATTRLHRGGRL